MANQKCDTGLEAVEMLIRSMTGCLRTTLNDLLGPDWLYQGQSADGGARLNRATEIISF